jgi:hypothetical protein
MEMNINNEEKQQYNETTQIKAKVEKMEKIEKVEKQVNETTSSQVKKINK